jgi:PLP dependent protein
MPFPDLPERLAGLRDQISVASARGAGQKVTIVAVTKTHGPAAVEAVWNAGIADVGENRVQEAISKQDAVSVPVHWHLIGHLQRNKVKLLDRFELLHSLDSARLADVVNEFGLRRGRPVRSLVQVNVAGEASKGGFELGEIPRVADHLVELKGIEVAGAMTMAPFDAPEQVLRETFAGARKARELLASAGHQATELSMGMSNDFEIAVEEGATIVRLGTALFGARPG